MSATVDLNVLLYASDETSPHHDRARDLLARLARGPDILHLFWPVLTGYLRIATHPAIFDDPLDPEAAVANVDALVRRPHVRAPGEDDGFWDLYGLVTNGIVVRGNLVPDAHLVTLMRQHGATTIWSHDRDLRRFDGISVRDPFD